MVYVPQCEQSGSFTTLAHYQAGLAVTNVICDARIAMTCTVSTRDASSRSSTWQPQHTLRGRAREEDAVDLARPHERLAHELALRVLPALKQPDGLVLAQRQRGRAPARAADKLRLTSRPPQ